MPAKSLNDRQLARIIAQIAQQSKQSRMASAVGLPVQQRFIDDPSRLKAAICTRRAGKSYASGLYLLQEALSNPGCTCLYIGLTRESAKRIFVRNILHDLVLKFGLTGKWNASELSYTLSNGSVLYLVGADASPEQRDKLLGQKYRLVIIDECASFRQDLEDLVYSVLMPAVADDRGTICLIGTPGNTKNFFFRVTQRDEKEREKGWSVHRWTWEDNPYVVNEMRDIIELRKSANPLIVETPQFRQQYLGEWTVDDSKLVYRFSDERNSASELPKQNVAWNYVIGLDLGFTDDTAWVICAYAQNDDRNLYVVDAIKRPKLIISQVAKMTQDLIDHYSPISIVVDPKAKQSVEEMRQRFGLPLEDAAQRDKVNAISMLNSDLITGVIKLLPNASDLKEEWENLVWDERELAKNKHVEHTACANHLSDAMLYAWRKARNYATVPSLPKPPPVDSDEWAQQFWEKDTLRLQRRQRQPWWERDHGEEEDAW